MHTKCVKKNKAWIQSCEHNQPSCGDRAWVLCGFWMGVRKQGRTVQIIKSVQVLPPDAAVLKTEENHCLICANQKLPSHTQELNPICWCSCLCYERQNETKNERKKKHITLLSISRATRRSSLRF